MKVNEIEKRFQEFLKRHGATETDFWNFPIIGKEEEEVREWAEDPNCPRHILETLFKTEMGQFCCFRNPSLPPELLWRRAKSPYSIYRMGVPRHPNVTRDILEFLLNDKNRTVVMLAEEALTKEQ